MSDDVTWLTFELVKHDPFDVSFRQKNGTSGEVIGLHPPVNTSVGYQGTAQLII